MRGVFDKTRSHFWPKSKKGKRGRQPKQPRGVRRGPMPLKNFSARAAENKSFVLEMMILSTTPRGRARMLPMLRRKWHIVFRFFLWPVAFLVWCNANEAQRFPAVVGFLVGYIVSP